MTEAAKPKTGDPAGYLEMPPERREAAGAHAAMLGETMRKLAADIPFQADVDEFRRVLLAEANR